jgi:hypothetical protein
VFDPFKAGEKSMKMPQICLLGALFSILAWGDDGIWLLNEFPRGAVRAKYGFDATDAFLRNLQLGSVRFNNGGSGSFVSPNGLVFTNHHVGSDCIQKLSTKEHDFMKDGFAAKTQDDERKCPDLELNVLLKMENVTEQVKASVPAGASLAEAGSRRRAQMSAIEKSCAEKTSHRCDVVTLFSGGQYHLYEYQKYTDIRLVFAPEKDIAFFGGDNDNFTYPRWNLDVAFFRVYENGKPLKTIHFFPWSKQGAKKGELTFVSGNPGSTGRLLSMAELELQRDVILPLNLDRHKNFIAALKRYSAKGPEQARVALEEIFGSENSFKALSGFMSGLQDSAFLARKRQEETKLRAEIAKDPERQRLYGSVWDGLASIAADSRTLYPKLAVLENAPMTFGSILPIARQVYRLPLEREKPNGERLREYAEAGLASLEDSLYSPAPLTPSLEEAILTEYLHFASRALGADNPQIKEILAGQTPEKAAAIAIGGTKLFDIAERKRLASSASLVQSSDDPLLRIIRILEPESRRVRKEYEDRVQSRQSIETARLAQAQYSLGGNIYPDATFTLRVSFGPVIGYKDKDGRAVNWSTDFAGLYRRNTGVDPFAIPKRWIDARNALRLSTPFNFVTTADTHGGNSGSPTVNTKGEVIGILFDGNIEGLPNRYLYTDERARSVHVASQGIVEALRKVYRAENLVKELGQ